MALYKHIVTPAGEILVKMKPEEEAAHRAEGEAFLEASRKRRIEEVERHRIATEKLSKLGLTPEDIRAIVGG